MKFNKSIILAIYLLGFTSTLISQALPNYVPSNGLVGWWPFNGNANDESGNGYNGSVYGASLSNDRNGNSNSAYSFDGISNFIWVGLVQELNGSSTASISYWINTPLSYPTNPAGNYGTAIGHWKHNGQPNGSVGIQLTNFSDGRVSVSLLGGQGEFSNSSLINVNTWTHICVTYDGNQPINQRIALYINGNFNQFINISNSPTALGTLATRTYIGAACGPDGQDDAWAYFNGSIDDVGMWNVALTQQEISNLFNAVNCASNTTITPQNATTTIGSTATFTASTSDPNPTFIWQSDLGQEFQTLNDLGNYSGTSTSVMSISNIQLSEHNQPIRVISTSGECIDTSEVAFISIIDTCINIVTDTTFISVTDTLIINTLITSVNPPNNTNTIKVYPNPTNSHLTIEYGDFALMNGYQLKIQNSIAQEVFVTEINQASDYLSLDTWGGNGLYFIHIIDPQGNIIDIRKIVLQ
jgi:hypothetical protein